MDRRILESIDRWDLDEPSFDRLACDLFAHQIRHNAPYAAFASACGFGEQRMPGTWREIPAVPSLAFKESVMTTFDPAESVVAFHTSGTTARSSGRHLFERTSLALYDAALLAGFDRFMLDGNASQRLRYFLLVPARDTSSLGYMMRRVAEERGDGQGGNYLDANGETLDVERFARDMRRAYEENAPVCVAGTAFAFVALIDALAGRTLRAASGSRVMETGGFKGRSREISRDDLYRSLARSLCVPLERVVAEYGMTELTSQYYDTTASRVLAQRRKTGPPWLRAVVVGPGGTEVLPGEVGVLRHIDLANRGSVLAIETEDLALRCEQGEFVLLGRDAQAPLRGCSLDAEDLLARRS
ncbi:MAG: acyl-protein synthetase [Vulcanimicrobiaceae bacterium]